MLSEINDIVAAYDLQAASLAELYEGVSAERIYADLAPSLSISSGLALDVGAGSGRDAAWLATLGYEVVAVEPAAGMRREGAQRHPDLPLRWIDDRLPDLSVVHRLGLAFDLVLLSAVWMHVPPPFRPRAFRKLVTLLKSGGTLLLSLRQGPAPPDRQMWPVTAGEIEGLARQHGLMVVRSVERPDAQGRKEISWTEICLRLPDDGAGALPLLRGIVLNDNKSSTYKLGLLRALARAADSAPSLATECEDDPDLVELPLGLVALYWIRMYMPLVAARLPQLPGNSGPEGLGFAKTGFRSLTALGVAAQELRVGGLFVGERADALDIALTEASRTISIMPANYIRYPNSENQVFAACPAASRRRSGQLILDGATFRAYGRIRIPDHVWRALQRLGAWVEPVLLSEWARLVRGYGERMSRLVAPGEVEAALAWLDPARDTALARAVAHRLSDSGETVRCVWSGAALRRNALDIDHCLPWSAWPCSDLWNLLPASRQVNQRLKRDRLPSAAALASARQGIVHWWETAWQHNPALKDRFEREAAAALPVPVGGALEDVFAALEWRRLRLRQDQQIEEWSGAATT